MVQENLMTTETPFLPLDPSPDSSENRITILATPLIGLLVTLKSAIPEKNKEDFHSLLLQIFTHFTQKAQKAGYSSRTVLAAQYCLCTALDEAIMNTIWGRETNWRDQSLLSVLYKETFGGERFYTILENMLSNPEENIDCLELIYILLSLGFKGKFYNKDPLFSEAMRIDLFKKISPSLRHQPKDYLLPPTNLENRKKKIAIPLWVICAVTILSLLTIILIYDYSLNRTALPIFDFLENLYAHPYNKLGNNYEKIS